MTDFDFDNQAERFIRLIENEPYYEMHLNINPFCVDVGEVTENEDFPSRIFMYDISDSGARSLWFIDEGNSYTAIKGKNTTYYFVNTIHKNNTSKTKRIDEEEFWSTYTKWCRKV